MSDTNHQGSRFIKACRLFDEANLRDPNKVTCEGVEYPHEYIYSRWLTQWVQKLAPDASEALLLAARCQHLKRWEIPRNTYPMNRPGYLKWRTDLKKFHAQQAAAILAQAGYAQPLIERVQALNLKQNIKHDPECQTLEDALCLVFLEHQFEAFMQKNNDEAKMIGILQKSWKKMSEAGHQAASQLRFPDAGQAIIRRAIENED